jgi:Phosphoribosyl-AMP cyclohydrolase
LTPPLSPIVGVALKLGGTSASLQARGLLVAPLGSHTYTQPPTSPGPHPGLIKPSDLAQTSSVAVPTYRLETFGKLVLSGGTPARVSHQKRRLALLALLAASRERSLSRDQLLAYLWLESTAANARHSLETGEMHYTSRTRGPWHKGATSSAVSLPFPLSL